jgi:hypothetical protein
MSVKDYIAKHDTSELRFCDAEDKEIKVEEELSLDNLVLKCLDLSYKYYSYNIQKNYIETYPNKVRSSLDIWRHIKYYLPDTTIYEVMNSLYRLRSKLVGQYCFTVSRRVFILFKYRESWGLCNQEQSDEYGLLFREWKDISEEID